MSLIISSRSSFFENKLGTSPVFNKLLISSKKLSKAIYTSVNIKLTGIRSIPAFFIIHIKSSLNDYAL